MPFHVLFRGLVQHCVDSGGETAVFPEVPAHDLRLVVFKADVVNNSFDEDPLRRHTNSEANPGLLDPNKMSLLIAGKHLRISGIGPSVRDTTTFFKRFVPKLKDATTCSAGRPEVATRTCVSGAIGGYFDHQPGVFSVTDFFPKKARYGNPVRLNCVARTVSLLLPPAGPTVIIQDDAQQVELASNATVLFINANAVGTAEATNAHFGHFAQLLAGACVVQAPQEDSEHDCLLPHPQDFHFPGTACGNTQGPPPP